jgi:hypothetical protein
LESSVDFGANCTTQRREARRVAEEIDAYIDAGRTRLLDEVINGA